MGSEAAGRSGNADRSLRLLVVTLSNIGDVVMTTPVFEALHARFPTHRIDCLGDARSSAVLAAGPYVGEVFERDKRAPAGAQLALLRRLRGRRYDAVVDLRTPVIAFLLRARRRCVKWRHDRPGLHAVEEHFAVVRPLLEPGAALPEPRVHPGTAAREAADGLLGRLPGSRWLALAPGANWPGKRWPAGHYRALVGAAAARYEGVVVLGGPDDREAAAAIEGATLPVLNLAGETTLPVAAALLERATAFVGNDSGLGHLAAAVGTPTLTVFGPGRPERYRPWGERARIVLAPERDLARLTPAAVLDALEKLPARAENER